MYSEQILLREFIGKRFMNDDYFLNRTLFVMTANSNVINAICVFYANDSRFLLVAD